MTTTKELKIQEAIRLVQECNYSRRKAASSTGISPNTLKRRLNGSIPREEYLERTKKITASEELILENMIIALIQHGEHIKASALRALVALYIQNKSAPTKLDNESTNDVEMIPKGWCTRFMKRSKKLVINQGYITIKDKTPAPPQEQLNQPAFAIFMKPAASGNESVAETQAEIVKNASTLIEGFRKDFEYSARGALGSLNNGNSAAELESQIEQLKTIFNDVTTLASVLNLTSHVSQQPPTLSSTGNAVDNSAKRTPTLINAPLNCPDSALPRQNNHHQQQQQQQNQPQSQEPAQNSQTRLIDQKPTKITIQNATPEFYNSATPLTPPSPLTPTSPHNYVQPSNKRRLSMTEGMLAPQDSLNQHVARPAKKQRQSGRSTSWSGDYDLFAGDNSITVPPPQWQDALAPATTTPFTAMLNAATAELKNEGDYFTSSAIPTTSAPQFDLMLQNEPVSTMFSAADMIPSIASASNDQMYGFGGDYGLASTFDAMPMLQSTAGVPVPINDFGSMNSGF